MKYGELLIAIIPIDSFHKIIEGTISGGKLHINVEDKELIFFSKSEDFGQATLKQIIRGLINDTYEFEDFEGWKYYYSKELTLEDAQNNKIEFNGL
jgi:hypothetical protein